MGKGQNGVYELLHSTNRNGNVNESLFMQQEGTTDVVSSCDRMEK